MSELPMHDVHETKLPAWPEEAQTALADAIDSEDPLGQLRGVAAAHPTYLDAWARLADRSLDAGDPVAAYAFARVGYHRGLDAIRAAGWRGQGTVPWSHEPNRGFLRSLLALMRAAEAIGEEGEPQRCREFLLQLDPGDAQGVG